MGTRYEVQVTFIPHADTLTVEPVTEAYPLKFPLLALNDEVAHMMYCEVAQRYGDGFWRPVGTDEWEWIPKVAVGRVVLRRVVGEEE